MKKTKIFRHYEHSILESQTNAWLKEQGPDFNFYEVVQSSAGGNGSSIYTTITFIYEDTDENVAAQ